MPVMQQPEAYIGGIATAFDPEGKLVDEPKRAFFEKFMQAFAAWVEQVGR
jgi:chromate reductase